MIDEKVAVVGLGYVGLPVALAFGETSPRVIGFDIDKERIAELQRHHDRNGEHDLSDTLTEFTDDAYLMQGSTFFVVAVPTPVDENKMPDLSMLTVASETVGRRLRRGCVVVYESTVYPGVTEEVCGPILERASGLTCGVDFTLGYSPERINPGDKAHTLKSVVKIVSGQDEATLDRVADAYRSIVPAGVFLAKSIRVAEAAKVIENTQRDLNVALMNELAIIFDRMGIRTQDVLAAAKTKWNFLPFQPGLVGGHCIGVDPHYLTAKAQQLGYQPAVILAGRRINDGMGRYIAQRLVKLLAQHGKPVAGARVGILGLTFKEDCADLRNTRVVDIVDELRSFSIDPLVSDPLARESDAKACGVTLSPLSEVNDLDALVLAVAHREYSEMPISSFSMRIRNGGVLMDVKSTLDASLLRRGVAYWSL